MLQPPTSSLPAADKLLNALYDMHLWTKGATLLVTFDIYCAYRYKHVSWDTTWAGMDHHHTELSGRLHRVIRSLDPARVCRTNNASHRNTPSATDLRPPGARAKTRL
jgi:hypothetical protein